MIGGGGVFCCNAKNKYINGFYACRPQEGFRNYRGTFSVMESRIIWWMEFGVVKMFFIRFRAFFTFLWCVRKTLHTIHCCTFRNHVVCGMMMEWMDDSYGNPYAYAYELVDINSYD